MVEQPENDGQSEHSDDKVSLSGKQGQRDKLKTSRLSAPENMEESPDAKTDETIEKRPPPQTRRTRRAKKPIDLDFVRETSILSKDNPLLKRALNQQSQSDDASDLTDTKIPAEEREVILLVRGMVERIVIQEGKTFKLGRFEMGANRADEVDLTPYGALDRGVSRVHAQLHMEDQQLYITDLESTNGTYLGGEKLPAEEPTQLKKGDELLLGRLAVQILFR